MSQSLRARGSQLFTVVGESAWVVLAFIVASTTVVLLASATGLDTWLEESTLGQLYATVLIYIAGVVALISPLVALRGRGYVAKVLGVTKKPILRLWWLPFALWVTYMAATTLAAVASTFIFPWIDQNQAQDVGFEDINQSWEYVAAFVGLVVLPPIAEELMFRGYLQGRLRERLGIWPTTLAVSAVFGLVHAQWNVGIDVFVLSLFLCYLRERTGSVWASMVLHGFKNAVAYFFLFIGPLIGIHLI